MYAIEAPPTSGHLSTDTSSLEQMTSNLYNLDSASISGYAHPSSHSPYNNQVKMIVEFKACTLEKEGFQKINSGTPLKDPISVSYWKLKLH